MEKIMQFDKSCRVIIKIKKGFINSRFDLENAGMGSREDVVVYLDEKH